MAPRMEQKPLRALTLLLALLTVAVFPVPGHGRKVLQEMAAKVEGASIEPVMDAGEPLPEAGIDAGVGAGVDAGVDTGMDEAVPISLEGGAGGLEQAAAAEDPLTSNGDGDMFMDMKDDEWEAWAEEQEAVAGNPDWFYDEEDEEQDVNDYDVNDMWADDGTGSWAWDDPLEQDDPIFWEDEGGQFVQPAPVRDDTINGRMGAITNALNAHVVPQSVHINNHATVAKAMVRQGVSEVLGVEDHPNNALLLEILTILPLLPPILLVAFLLRAASQSLTMHHLVQFACLFCAGYSFLLISAAMLTGDDPLAAFQYMAGKGPYIKYQLLVAAAYSLFLILLYLNVCVQRCSTGALFQQVMGTFIGLHYYLGTFHPAMVSLPPETVFGLATGMQTYILYFVAFFMMGAVPTREKALTEEAEDDKTLGEGKGQD